MSKKHCDVCSKKIPLCFYQITEWERDKTKLHKIDQISLHFCSFVCAGNWLEIDISFPPSARKMKGIPFEMMRKERPIGALEQIPKHWDLIQNEQFSEDGSESFVYVNRSDRKYLEYFAILHNPEVGASYMESIKIKKTNSPDERPFAVKRNQLACIIDHFDAHIQPDQALNVS